MTNIRQAALMGGADERASKRVLAVSYRSSREGQYFVFTEFTPLWGGYDGR